MLQPNPRFLKTFEGPEFLKYDADMPANLQKNMKSHHSNMSHPTFKAGLDDFSEDSEPAEMEQDGAQQILRENMGRKKYEFPEPLFFNQISKNCTN